jgi:signal peptidase I
MNRIRPNPTRRQRLRDWLPTLALLGLLFVTRASLANHYVVPSGSMEPTLQPGDRVFVDMSAYGLRVPYTETVLVERGRPQRGDVVLLPSPATGDRLIKRIVGIAGDRVTLHGGRLAIDGMPAAGGDGRTERIGVEVVPLNLAHGGGPDVDVVVPEGHVLVVGDNRGNSLDGRMFGFVRESAVYAKARGVFWRSGERFTWKPL